MTTCLMPPCADHATSTWSAVSLATVDGSAGRFVATAIAAESRPRKRTTAGTSPGGRSRSEEHTSELQSPCNLVCRLLLEKKNRTLKKRTQANDFFCWTPNGRLVYRSADSGKVDLWIMKADGTQDMPIAVRAVTDATPART